MNLNAIKRYVQLRQAITAEKLSLETRLAAINRALGGSVPAAPQDIKRGKRKMSAAARGLIAAAQKSRWAKLKADKPSATAAGGKRHKMSPAARRRISEAAKKRWAVAKAAGKKRL